MKLAFIAATAALFLSSCKNRYDLQFKPTAGSKYEVRMTTNSVTTQEMMGQKIDIKSLTEMTMWYDIQDNHGHGSGGKLIKITFKSMKSSQSANGEESMIDSDKYDSSNAGWKMINSLIGAEFTIAINPNGEVQDIKGKDALVARINRAFGGADAQTRAQMAVAMENFMSNEILKNMTEQSLKVFPAEKVKTGDQWKNSMVITKPMPMNIASTYTLKDANENQATIKLASLVTPGSGEMEMMGMKIGTELSGTQTGTIHIDTETGMPLNADITQQIAGKMTAMGQDMPMNIQSVITMTSKKR